METDSVVTDLDGKVWLKSIDHPNMNRAVDVAQWGEITRDARTGMFAVKGRAAPVAVHDQRSSPGFALTVWTDDMRADTNADPIDDAAHLDLLLATAGTLFVHVPADSQIPGGYVTVDNNAVDRVVRHGTVPRRLVLPCTVVAPPDAEVTGADLTWGDVRDLYGGWAALVAAHPSLADDVAGLSSEDDVVSL